MRSHSQPGWVHLVANVALRWHIAVDTGVVILQQQPAVVVRILAALFALVRSNTCVSIQMTFHEGHLNRLLANRTILRRNCYAAPLQSAFRVLHRAVAYFHDRRFPAACFLHPFRVRLKKIFHFVLAAGQFINIVGIYVNHGDNNGGIIRIILHFVNFLSLRVG